MSPPPLCFRLRQEASLIRNLGSKYCGNSEVSYFNSTGAETHNEVGIGTFPKGWPYLLHGADSLTFRPLTKCKQESRPFEQDSRQSLLYVASVRPG
jgi:hypothetical protein